MNDWLLWQRLQDHARDDARRVAYVEQASGRSITYAELVDRVSSSTAAAKVEVLIVGNRIDFVVRFLAALLHGHAVLPADVTVPPPELARLKELADGDDATGPAVLLASSGTTGQPKLIRRERAALDAVARAMSDSVGFGPADRVLAAVPLAHSYGLEHGLLSPLWAGSTVLLCDGLDLPPVAAAWRHGATIFPAVPSMLEMLLRGNLPPASSLRRIYTAGAPLPLTIADAFTQTYGVKVGQVYGMTEIGSVVYHDPNGDAWRDRPGTVGRAVSGVSLRTDADGELLVKSQGMLSRYIGDDLHLIDGHFPTGDLATIDADGQLTLLGRRRLLIDVGGAKVNPHEVEAVLAQHPAVAACVVLPLRLSETVCRVRAIVVPSDTRHPPAAADLRAFVRERLARHKVPRLIEFRDDLPRSAAGKVARQLLETP
ncbi:MAG TPA: AMP-binding protein [Tepidisphaeraceae bacterium]|jgi:acyl-coenzyme A synthetase/AMP-(fatty) acid ligase